MSDQNLTLSTSIDFVPAPSPSRTIDPVSLSPPRSWRPRRFLSAMWRCPERQHLIAVKYPDTAFRNIPVAAIEEASSLALKYSDEGADVYSACAEYLTPDNRTAANAVGAWAFWMDIDCGPEKAAAGKGYATTELALEAVEDFCKKTGIPKPNDIVESGGGLHVYWRLGTFLPKSIWQEWAKKFKALGKVHGLLADPSRTADVASVLRVPGTLNYKYDPPRHVTQRHGDPTDIEWSTMQAAIDLAHAKIQSPAPKAVKVVAPSVNRPLDSNTLRRLSSALPHVGPDCDDGTWKLQILAPLARAARDNPDQAAALRQLGVDFSSGTLRGRPSEKWTTPGQSNGRTGQEVFEEVWQRFLTEEYGGAPTTLGSIFHLAKESGWVDDVEAFEQIAEDKPNAILDGLSEKTETDVGAPFMPDVITALKAVRQDTPAEYQRIRADLKRANPNVSVGELDKLTKAKGTAANAQTHHGYAKGIIQKLTAQGWRPVSQGGVLYAVDPESALWVPYVPSDLERSVAEAYDGRDHCRRASDYRDIAQHVIGLSSDLLAFEKAPPGIACPDGFYRIEGSEIRREPLIPDHRQRLRLPFTPKSQGIPLFDAFLRETFQASDRPGEEQQQINLVQEIAGAIMIGIMARFQKAVLFYDPYGRAGKGTLERVLRCLVPDSLVTAVSPFKWGQDYHLAALAGSRLNVVGELPDETAIPASDFKTVTGGDPLTGRHPNYRPFTFKNEAGHLFMSNHLINTRDHSDAFFSRWILVEFPNSRLRSGLPIDPDLADRIIREELPGIAFWALEGAARVLSQGGFSASTVHDRLMAQWRRRSNSVEEFLHDCCDVGSTAYKVRRSELYKAYASWCSETGRKAFAKSRFKDLMLHNAGGCFTLSELNGHETFRGVQLKDVDDVDLT